jgi:FkbM family methyltransferase
MIKILYGVENNYRDMTYDAYLFMTKNNKIYIQIGDLARANIFGDFIYGVLKHIKVYLEENQEILLKDDEEFEIDLTIGDRIIEIEKYKKNYQDEKKNWFDTTIIDPLEKVKHIHKNVKFLGGDIFDEVPEQRMVAQFLNPKAKVLELGSNIGRNTIIISTILEDENNLVTLETDPRTARILDVNRRSNFMNFKIENSALSSRKLIQRGWETIPSDVVHDGYTTVNVISYQGLIDKYNIEFDTLVVDCEGALYYIFQDFPNILNNIQMIIMENDYHDMEKKNFVDSFMVMNQFERIYSEEGGWGPCFSFFYEVWKRRS